MANNSYATRLTRHCDS